jgi:hypothetical protein
VYLREVAARSLDNAHYMLEFGLGKHVAIALPMIFLGWLGGALNGTLRNTFVDFLSVVDL